MPEIPLTVSPGITMKDSRDGRPVSDASRAERASSGTGTVQLWNLPVPTFSNHFDCAPGRRSAGSEMRVVEAGPHHGEMGAAG